MRSASGGKAAAIAYTLVETARLNDDDPQARLAQLLELIPDYKINRIDELLPWNTATAEDRKADNRSRKAGQAGRLRTFSPSRRHRRSTRLSLTCQPASRSRAAIRR